MSCSRCRTSFLRWRFRIAASSTGCCSVPLPKPCRRSPGIRNTWVRNLVASRFCTLGEQTVLAHPHLHCVIPGGGISPDGKRWVRCRDGFFLPVRVMSRMFRGTFPLPTRDAFSSTPPKMRFRSCAEDSKVSAISHISTSHNSIFRSLPLRRSDSTPSRIRRGFVLLSSSFDLGSCSSTPLFASTVSTKTLLPMSPPFWLTSVSSSVCFISPLLSSTNKVSRKRRQRPYLGRGSS